MTKQEQEQEFFTHIEHLAEEQVLFLKNRYKMNPQDIIHMYGGQTLGTETYQDAVERIAAFNIMNAGKNGFVAN